MPQGLKEGSAYMVGSLFISMAATFGAQVIASRALGPVAYGVYGLVIANSLLVVGFFDAGFSAAMATFIAERDARRDEQGLVAIVKSSLAVETVLVVVLLAAVFLFLQPLSGSFFLNQPGLLFFFLILVSVQGFYGIFAGVVQGFRELRSLSIVRSLHQLSLLVLTTLLLLKLLPRTSTAALWLNVLSLSFAMGLSALLTYHYIRQRRASGGNDAPQKAYLSTAKSIALYALPISLASVATSAIQSSGPAILNFFSNNNPGAQLGILAVILSLARVFDRLLNTVIRSAFPFLVHWNTMKDHRKTRQYTNMISLLIFGGYTALIIGAILLGQPIVNLVYGKAYSEVARYLPLGFVAFAAVSMQDVYRISLFSLKKVKEFLGANLLGLVVFCVSVLLGRYVLRLQDYVTIVLLSMALANSAIAVAAWMLFRGFIKRTEKESPTLPNAVLGK